MNKHRKTKLRHFTWDKSKVRNSIQILIEDTVKEWYDAKHPKDASKDEISFINGIKVKHCPFCNVTQLIKYGKSNRGIQIYYCKTCHKKFNPLTNTIFDSKKIPISEWIEYLLHLFEFHSIKSSSFDNRNANSTGKYWLFKVFEVLKGIQDNVVLKDTIWLDETYLPVIKSKVEIKNGKKLRGISRNKIGIACAKDKYGNSIIISTGVSKPSFSSTYKAYSKHIEESSTIIHDEEKSHSILIEKLNLKSIVYSSIDLKKLKDEDNPLEPINRIHFYLKKFIKVHGGYKREDLQDWLNLFWFIMNGPDDKYEKVLKFIDLSKKAPKKVRYRDVMSKKIK